jgi:hypothetical protein
MSAKAPNYQQIVQKLFGFNGVKFPRRMPPDYILRHLANPPTKKQLRRMRPGLVQELRNTCHMLGLDPVEHLNLKPEPSAADLVQQLPDSFFLPKGYDREVRSLERYASPLIFISLELSPTVIDDI